MNKSINKETQPTEVYNKIFDGIHAFSQWWRVKDIFKSDSTWNQDLTGLNEKSSKLFMQTLDEYRKK